MQRLALESHRVEARFCLLIVRIVICSSEGDEQDAASANVRRPISEKHGGSDEGGSCVAWRRITSARRPRMVS